jgi:hypothetical protein
MVNPGWGQFLGWWSFGYLAVWAIFALRNAGRDWNKAGLGGLH